MESVDIGDLKSPDLWSCQFESGRGHHLRRGRKTRERLINSLAPDGCS